MAENGLTLLQDLVGGAQLTVFALQLVRHCHSDQWRSNGSLRAFSSLLGPLRSPASRAA
jgi:hypothetical protein